MIEDNENGQNFGSDSGNGVRSDSGKGSDGSAIGSGGSVDGSGGSDNGSGGSDSGSGGIDGSARSVGSNNVKLDSNNGIGNESENRGVIGNVSRSVRAERIRAGRPIRIGESNRDRDSDAASASGTAGNGTERNIGSDSEPVIRLGSSRQGKPKNVRTDEAPTTDYKLNQSKDVIKMFVESVFNVPAAILNQDFWKLNKDESKALTDAIIQWLESMPKSRQSKIALFINENMPVINLAMVAFFIVSDRVKASMHLAQIEKSARSFKGLNISPENMPNPNNIRTPLDSIFNN